VFVTACQPSPDGEALIAGELPRTHCYYSDLDGFPVRPDTMPLLELCRQACFVLAHRVHGVPIGWQFILRTMSIRIFRPSAGVPGKDADGPLRVLLRCYQRQRWDRNGSPSGLEWEFKISTAPGEPFASVTAKMSWMPPDKWAEVRARLRGGHGRRPAAGYSRPPRASVPAVAVGRKNQANVVITNVRCDADDVQADMLVDLGNAGLFDHYNDHIPGMVEAEAARQLAIVAVARSAGLPARSLQVGALTLTFARLGELDLPAACLARVERGERTGQHSVAVRIVQASEIIAHASVLVVERDGDENAQERRDTRREP
jgi:hypothetical protein